MDTEFTSKRRPRVARTTPATECPPEESSSAYHPLPTIDPIAFATWRKDAEQTLVRLAAWAEATEGAALRPFRPYFTYDFGRKRDLSGVSIVLPEQEARIFLSFLRSILPGGLKAFLGTSVWRGREKHTGTELVVAPAASPADIVLLARTAGFAAHGGPEALAHSLRTHEGIWDIDVFRAETGSVEFLLLLEPADMDGMVSELADLCPDTLGPDRRVQDAWVRDLRHRKSGRLRWH